MSTIATTVLYYDHSSEIKKQSPRMWEAMREFASGEPALLKGWFGFGQIVAWDHSGGYQVCVIHGNTGWRLGNEDKPPPQYVLDSVATALRRHGYKVTQSNP